MRLLILALILSSCGDNPRSNTAKLVIPGYSLSSTDAVIVDIYDMMVGFEWDNRSEDDSLTQHGGVDIEIEITTGEKFVDVLVVEDDGDILCGQTTIRLWPGSTSELVVSVSKEKCCNLTDYLGEPKDFDPVAAYCESIINN